MSDFNGMYDHYLRYFLVTIVILYCCIGVDIAKDYKHKKKQKYVIRIQQQVSFLFKLNDYFSKH